MNLSETAFLLPEKDGFRLRWFTPKLEVRLCGHATLACAHILWENAYLPSSQPARFFTHSGLLTCSLQGDWIAMDFPVVHCQPCVEPAGLLAALGIEKALSIQAYPGSYLVEVESESLVRALQPDFTAVSKLASHGIIVTSRADAKGVDFVSRFFAPSAGINEDPVTGSAHCTLAPYWAKRLGKTEFHAYQVSARGGELKVWLTGERVILLGQAVTVLNGELTVGI
jgi:PhzF family phenazine biosynthesis protein